MPDNLVKPLSGLVLGWPLIAILAGSPLVIPMAYGLAAIPAIPLYFAMRKRAGR